MDRGSKNKGKLIEERRKPMEKEEEFRLADAEAEEEKRRELRITDLAKRLFQTGAGAVFTTEEAFRNFLKEQFLKGKDEVLGLVAKELKAFLDRVDLDGIVTRAMENFSVEIQASLRFVPKEKEKAKENPPGEKGPRKGRRFKKKGVSQQGFSRRLLR